MLMSFGTGVGIATRQRLGDPIHPFPFANIEGPTGRKRHGIGGPRVCPYELSSTASRMSAFTAA
jgi:hypothetical protein